MHDSADHRPPRHRNPRANRRRVDYPLDEIRRALGGTMRLSFDKLVHLGYSRDGAKELLLSMTRGIAGHLDDQEQAQRGLGGAKHTRSGEPGD